MVSVSTFEVSRQYFNFFDIKRKLETNIKDSAENPLGVLRNLSNV